jgi:chromosome segregation ATPase
MAAKFKQHSRKEIIAGKVELPDDLSFLSDADYFAIAEQRVQGVREWYVEIKASSLKSFLQIKVKLNAARLKDRKLKAEVEGLKDEALYRENELQRSRSKIDRLNEKIHELERSLERASAANEALQADVSNKSVEVRNVLSELNSLKVMIEPLQEANAKLMENAELDVRQHRGQKSPKNFFTEMEERGVGLNGPAIRGGSGGSNKR